MPQVPVVFSTTLASGVTLGSSVDLMQAWKNVALEIPLMGSSSVFVKASADNINFYRLSLYFLGSSWTITDFNIPNASIFSAGAVVSLSNPRISFGNLGAFKGRCHMLEGIRYVKIESSSGCTDVTKTYKFICS